MVNVDSFFEQTVAPKIEIDGKGENIPLVFLDALTSAKSHRDILDLYSKWARRLIGSDRVSIAFKDPEDQSDCLIHTIMDGRQGLPPNVRFPIHGTIIGEVYRRKELLYLPKIDAVPTPDAQRIHQLGYVSAILAPIVSGNRCFGILAASFQCEIDDPAKVMAIIQILVRFLGTQLRAIDEMTMMRGLAETDPLTGAYNRRYFDLKGAELWQAWRTRQKPFSALIIDIDRFKAINDSYGHDVGDMILRTVVQRTRESSDHGRDVIRIGGEEFCLFFDDKSTDPAKIAQQILTGMGATPIAVGNATIRVTSSIGVATVCTTDIAISDVIKRADEALYQAKADGRNQVFAA